MNRGTYYFKSLAFLLIITISYAQFIQFEHRFLYHDLSASLQKPKQAQLQQAEASCLICDYLLHFHSVYTFEAPDGKILRNHQKGSRLLALYQVAQFSFFSSKNKNRGPPSL